jgi:hypothetical protein
MDELWFRVGVYAGSHGWAMRGSQCIAVSFDSRPSIPRVLYPCEGNMRGIYRLDVAMRCCQRTERISPERQCRLDCRFRPRLKDTSEYLIAAPSSLNSLQIPALHSDYNVTRQLIGDVDSASLKFSKSSMYMSRVERISRDSVSLAEMGKRVR